MYEIKLVFVIVIVLFAFIFGVVLSGKRKKARKTQEQFYDEQQERVRVGGYKKQKFLNRTEQIARKAIWKAVYDKQQNKNLQLFAQASLGEILSHQNKKLYMDINSKRVDFVLVEKNYLPHIVIEIHGQGHYSNSATKRDIIKRNAIESAGIHYLPIAVGSEEEVIFNTVYEAVIGVL
ncbi:MAG: DUF2726 domain-containing protein [Gammaproteobacteria bacterium]|nr:DUF2726 domain-containing protein [Gammaproteobacteria bacterium]